MKQYKLVDKRQFILLMSAPIIAIVVIFIVAGVQSIGRYNPAYFNDEYNERYASPGQVASDVERALRTNDAALWLEAHGTSYTPAFEPKPNVILAILLDAQDRYFDYLYSDFRTFDRYTYHIKQAGSRYVVVDEDVYYYVDSGRWSAVVMPLAYTWWLLIVLYSVMKALNRYMAGVRDQMYHRGA